MTTPTLADALIEAWWTWTKQPRSETTTNRKMDLLDALGLPGIDTHHTVAEAMRAGQDVPSAVQTAINHLAPHLTTTADHDEWKEAS